MSLRYLREKRREETLALVCGPSKETDEEGNAPGGAEETEEGPEAQAEAAGDLGGTGEAEGPEGGGVVPGGPGGPRLDSVPCARKGGKGVRSVGGSERVKKVRGESSVSRTSTKIKKEPRHVKKGGWSNERSSPKIPYFR